MKTKQKVLTICMFVLVISGCIFLSNNATQTTYSITEVEYGTYEDAQKMIKEVMKSYYIRGPYIQYNYAKTKYGYESPEIATSQNILYMVCAAFSYDLYTEAFGVKNSASADGDFRFPIYNTDVSAAARKYYITNKNNPSLLNSGNFLIYYKGPNDETNSPSEEDVNEDEEGIMTEETDEIINFTYNDTTSNINAFVQSIKPGDIFVYSGHVLVAYDIFLNDDGNWDVLLLNSGQSPYIPTRIASTSKISYSMFKGTNNNIIDVDAQGTIKWTTLRRSTYFIKDGSLKCPKTDECAVIRIFYEKDGKAVFNYTINEENYSRSMLRTEYPGLLIEKTVDKGTNNSIYIGDTLEYTIKITNKSGVTYDPIDYSEPFEIEETLGEYVEYITSNGEYANGSIKWHFNNLAAGDTTELTYKVKVKETEKNVLNTVVSNGNFYKSNNKEVSINTGPIKNKIIPKVTKKTKTYEECYNLKEPNYEGLELIDEIYKCVFSDEDLDLNNFNFNDFFFRNKSITASKAATDRAYVNENNKYSKMILNNYWSAMLLIKSDNSYDTIIPRLSSTIHPRAKTIYSDDFKDGDVLIYSIDYDNGPINNITYSTPNSKRHTKENGIYAYIYLNGEFIGKNGTELTERNVFNYEYYLNNSLSISSHLYAGYTDTQLKTYPSEIQDKVLTYANYQTLYDKDNYVILRPELAIKEIINIEVTTLPTKQTYTQNTDELDLTGGILTVTYNDGTTNNLDLNDTNISITGYDNKKIGINTINVTYEGENTTFNITNIASVYKISYYQENTKFNTSTECTYNTSCTIANYKDLTTNLFPLNSNGWLFAGYSKTFNGITRDYTAGQSFTYNMTNDLNLYTIGVRNFRFSSGIAPTTNSGNIAQYWNPYQNKENYVTSFNVPSASIIDGWTFIGYSNTSTATENVIIPNNITKYAPSPSQISSLDFRAIYERNISIFFDSNGGIGEMAPIIKTQYYNSGFGEENSNRGSNISDISLILPTSNFTKEGYTFIGWGETPNTTDIILEESDYTKFNPQVDNQNTTKTLYAIWEKTVNNDSNMKKNKRPSFLLLILLVIGLIITGVIVYIIVTKKKNIITDNNNSTSINQNNVVNDNNNNTL